MLNFVENQYITDLKAKAEEQEIDLKSYIKQDSSVVIKAELIELSDKISITDGKLKIPAYYIGKVGVKYTVTQTGYKDATADLYINIAYAELDDTMLSESIDTKTVYSNKEGHRAIIQATDGYDLYVLKYSDGSAPELSSSTDKKVNDGDGKITLSENTSGSENYRIYATDRNKIIYSKDVVINTDTVAPTASGFEWMAYNLTDNTDTGSNTFSTSIENRKSVYAAYLEDLTKKTSFSLTGVEDNLSGIDNVYYFLSTKILTDGFDSIKWKAGSIDNNGTVKIELDNNNKLDDGIYYIYYKLADKAGNVSYYNGVGMELVMDNTAPTITMSYQEKGSEEDKDFDEKSLLTGKPVDIKFNISDTNLNTDSNHNQITIKKDRS